MKLRKTCVFVLTGLALGFGVSLALVVRVEAADDGTKHTRRGKLISRRQTSQIGAGVRTDSHVVGSAARACEEPEECDDGNPCTRDTCILNICIHTVIQPCNPCLDDIDCDDDDDCTADVCSEAGLCENPEEPDQTPCPDELYCNGEETCASGICIDGSGPCVDLEHCDEDDDVCLSCVGDDECDDANPCTFDACIDNECAHTSDPGCESITRLDIKPGSCPNPFNVRSKGVVPVAIVGSEELDVTQIDVDSIVLIRDDGVGGEVTPMRRLRGPRVAIADVATPFAGEQCDCHTLAEDGIDDLSLKFSTEELVDVLELGSVPRGEFVTLTINATLLDGTEFSVSDCVLIVGRP